MSNQATLAAFKALWHELECKGSAQAAYELLAKKYGDAGRHYHTLEHVYWGLKRAHEIAEAEKYPEEQMLPVYWAMWFHDMCMSFDPLSAAKDEELSAAMAVTMAVTCAHGAGLSASFKSTVHRLIMATAHLKPPAQVDEAILVDADLSMLGAERPNFERYEAQVREEWSHVADASFCRGREKVLARFASMPRIFTTDTAYGLWEDRARDNINWSRARLATCALDESHDLS